MQLWPGTSLHFGQLQTHNCILFFLGKLSHACGCFRPAFQRCTTWKAGEPRHVLSSHCHRFAILEAGQKNSTAAQAFKFCTTLPKKGQTGKRLTKLPVGLQWLWWFQVIFCRNFIRTNQRAILLQSFRWAFQFLVCWWDWLSLVVDTSVPKTTTALRCAYLLGATACWAFCLLACSFSFFFSLLWLKLFKSEVLRNSIQFMLF